MATVTTMGYFGFLAGPPLIGFTAELLGLRCALGIIVATSSMIVMFAPVVGQGCSSANRKAGFENRSSEKRRRLAAGINQTTD
jgi:MFS family permease